MLKLTDHEIKEIFPDERDTILLKLAEWQDEREKVLSNIQEKLALIKQEAKDDFTYFFYREVLKYFDGKELIIIDRHIKRLKRLLAVYDGNDVISGYDENTKQEALRVPIQEILPQMFKKSGNKLLGLCPFHEEDHASFYIYPDTNSFYCFGCHAGGDAIRLVQTLNGCTFHQAIKHLTGGA